MSTIVGKQIKDNTVPISKLLGTELDARIKTVGGKFDAKDGCTVATTTSLTQSGLQIIDDYQTVAGDRILDKDNTDQTKRGIYVASAGAWTRATDFDETDEISQGAFTFIAQGTVNAKITYLITGKGTGANGGFIVGTDAINFTANQLGALVNMLVQNAVPSATTNFGTSTSGNQTTGITSSQAFVDNVVIIVNGVAYPVSIIDKNSFYFSDDAGATVKTGTFLNSVLYCNPLLNGFDLAVTDRVSLIGISRGASSGVPVLPQYSTTEFDTGRKWIDGKTIYGKVLSGFSLAWNGTTPVTANIAHTTTGLTKLISIVGSVSYSGQQITLGGDGESANHVRWRVRAVTDSIVQVQIVGIAGTVPGDFITADNTVYFEYTK
jgi:uncharacterized cupin superfamily protein